jgi:hypothetical protein
MNKIEAIKFRDVIQEFINGKDIQRYSKSGWLDCLNPQFTDGEEYRVKPAKIEKDLEFEDIWPGSVIRLKGDSKYRWMITYWSEKEIEAEVPITFAELKEGYDINRSLARGKWDSEAWEPCSK